MTSNDAVIAVIDALHASQVGYMLSGSLASNFYGIARSTNDADFVLELGPHSIAEVVRHLGSDFRFDPQMSVEGVTATKRFVVEAKRIGFTIDLFLLSDDPHDQSRFGRRRQVLLLGRDVFAPTVEDVIITKIRWYKEGRRNKDRQDVEDVLSVYTGNIDWNYITRWCQQHSTSDLLQQIRDARPPI